MTCRAPLEAAQHETGGKPVVYKRGHRPKSLAEGYAALDLPCGQCISCRREKGRLWAARMMHEAAYWEDQGKYNIFLTLTYEDKHLPMYGMLNKKHLQDFFKRLRARIAPEKFRYYVVGEYGTQCPDHEIENCPKCGPLQRPHYHAIIFGWSPPDKMGVTERDGYTVYQSETIDAAWTKTDETGEKTVIGSHEIGSVTFESCSYISDYIMKKFTGNEYEVADHYCKYLWQIDAWVDMEPEFAMMSRRPGIGYEWFQRYQNDIYPSDEMPIPGRFVFCQPPKYYDGFRKETHPEEMQRIQDQRRRAMAESLANGPTLYQRAQYEDALIKRRTQP